MSKCQICKTALPDDSRRHRKTCSARCKKARQRKERKKHVFLKQAKTYEWETPDWLFKALDRRFHFTLDACASDTNHKCKRYYTIADDGLKAQWGKDEVVYLNPPYGPEIELWLKKAAHGKGTVVALIPANTDTGWWHDYVVLADKVLFFKGRIQFLNANGHTTNSATFPSALAVFRPKRGVKLPVGVFDLLA